MRRTEAHRAVSWPATVLRLAAAVLVLAGVAAPRAADARALPESTSALASSRAPDGPVWPEDALTESRFGPLKGVFRSGAGVRQTQAGAPDGKTAGGAPEVAGRTERKACVNLGPSSDRGDRADATRRPLRVLLGVIRI